MALTLIASQLSEIHHCRGPSWKVLKVLNLHCSLFQVVESDLAYTANTVHVWCGLMQSDWSIEDHFMTWLGDDSQHRVIMDLFFIPYLSELCWPVISTPGPGGAPWAALLSPCVPVRGRPAAMSVKAPAEPPHSSAASMDVSDGETSSSSEQATNAAISTVSTIPDKYGFMHVDGDNVHYEWVPLQRHSNFMF